MIKEFLAVGVFVTLWSIVATAQSIALHAGDTITLTQSDAGLSIADRRPAPAMSAFEASVLRQMQTTKLPADMQVAPPMPIADEVPPPPLTPGLVRITFREVAGIGQEPHAMLTIENGYNRSVLYRAIMHRGSQSAPTDVCEILPGKWGFEHWPFKIEWLELSELRLEVPLERRMRCQ